MRRPHSTIRGLVILFIGGLLTSCTSYFSKDANSVGSSSTGPTIAALSAELNRLEFRAGHPQPGESLVSALREPPQGQLDLLEENLKILKMAPDIYVEVIGFTDKSECDEPKCGDLSMRRATYARMWLIEHGISPKQLKGPSAGGSQWPVDRSNSEDAKGRNRRVQFDFVSAKS